MKSKKNKNPFVYNKFFPILLFVATLFMGVGYASINSISLDIDGSALAKVPDGVYITEVNYKDDINADLENSSILNTYQTMMKSNIYLSSTDVNSTITYEITIYNSDVDPYRFGGVDYILGDTTYSNEGISFDLNNLTEGYILYSKSYITFTLTFCYSDGVLSSNNSLLSYLNFNFEKIIVWDAGSISGGMSSSITNTNILNYDNFTVDNYFFEVESIVVPNKAYGTITFTKSYNPSSGTLTISRNSITGSGTILFNGHIYASEKADLLFEGASGGYNITVDCTSVDDWQEKTKDDFFIDLNWVLIPNEAYGTMNFTKSYDSTTGKLTITRSAIVGSGIISFEVDVYSY